MLSKRVSRLATQCRESVPVGSPHQKFPLQSFQVNTVYVLAGALDRGDDFNHGKFCLRWYFPVSVPQAVSSELCEILAPLGI
jgi:hypothetical protein